ncbi:VOC family protein [Plastoroseomonas arctica]|uniref:Glyoxalase/bleomycin resistance/extradiol dioxygenase family protein n=1 Tax=Plastoroseomonas arctica TaxID=1509237 RepID=A0AAF1KI40_9PROT|nr:VOC family protein [Plastoroseomonas arctica]MBR0654090.1 glyoxalase/bleomycin resistance/extradiol dioxygenase family protein [Plastoroseomonas arctica]
MTQKVFINLPVTDLPRATAFYNALGFPTNPQFSNEMASSIVLSEHNYIMLLTHPFFAGFTPKPIADAHQVSEVLLALDCESREAVDAMVDKALAAGGATYAEAKDMGFMYSHGFADPDGHIIEVFWMPGPPPG